MQNRILEKMEDRAELVVKKIRPFLPTLGRLCLIATFLEDGIRLCCQWTDQVNHLNLLWNTYTFFSAAFILLNIVGQIVGSLFVLLRYKVRIGCAMLMFLIVFQTIGYHIWSLIFLMRNLALVGSLLLLVAESDEKIKPLLAGLPETGDNQPKKYLFLGGRLMVVLIFLTIFNWNTGIIYLIQIFANLILILMVAVGYRTKLCAMILVSWLGLINMYYNCFWTAPVDSYDWDYLKYDFFQTGSVIGGLLLLVAYGPGAVSLDDYKKNR